MQKKKKKKKSLSKIMESSKEIYLLPQVTSAAEKIFMIG
jgi:hypothetical protein